MLANFLLNFYKFETFDVFVQYVKFIQQNFIGFE